MSQKSKDFDIICKIGQGSFGTVFKVRRKSDKSILVLKMIKMQTLSKKHQQDSLHEVTVLSSLANPYIVKYYDSFVENATLNIIMEYCEKGDLSQAIKKGSLTENRIWKYFIQCCIALEYLHSKQILHRDIKCLNVFLSNDDTVRVGDLGVAKILNNPAAFAQTQVGSPYYLSPELCEEKPYNTKSDVWALGCVLYEMCTGKHPFTAPNQAALLFKIVKGAYAPLSFDFSEGLRNLVDLCLEKDYKKRPNISLILTRSDIETKTSELNIVVPYSSTLSKNRRVDTSIEAIIIPMTEKSQKPENTVVVSKFVEEVQRQLSENRKIVTSNEKKVQRPLSAKKPEINLGNKVQYGDFERKIGNSPMRINNFNVVKQDVVKMSSGREKLDYFDAEKVSDRELPHKKKKSLGEMLEKRTASELKGYRNVRNSSPDKKEVLASRDFAGPNEVRRESKDMQNIYRIEAKLNQKVLKVDALKGIPERIFKKPTFPISLKQGNNKNIVEEGKELCKHKVPITAKMQKLEYMNDDVKMVQNLPEIPRTRSKRTVKYLQESSPVRLSKYPTKVFFKLQKPLLEPIMMQSSGIYTCLGRLNSAQLISKVANSYTGGLDSADTLLLKNKEKESVENEETLRKKCSELRCDIIKMVGGNVFNEMHNIFTSIITKDEVTELDQIKIERFVNRNIRGESSKAIFSMYKLLNAETDLAKTEEMIRSIRSGLHLQ